jgi:hypothetical protein
MHSKVTNNNEIKCLYKDEFPEISYEKQQDYTIVNFYKETLAMMDDFAPKPNLKALSEILKHSKNKANLELFS